MNKKEELKRNIKNYNKSLTIVCIICGSLFALFMGFFIGLKDDNISSVFRGLAIGDFVLLILLAIGFTIPKEKAQKELEKIIQAETDFEKAKEKPILKTKILSAALKKDKDDAFSRGAVGTALFGAAGAVVGTASANEINFTTFLIIYTDESRETKEVENGTDIYNYYIQYLEI